MKSLVAATFSHGGSSTSLRPSFRLLSLAPAALLLSGLFALGAGPLASPVAAAATAPAAHRLQRQISRIAMKSSAEVISMVSETAMP